MFIVLVLTVSFNYLLLPRTGLVRFQERRESRVMSTRDEKVERVTRRRVDVWELLRRARV